MLYGVPFLEVRGVSNVVADRDRSAWDLEGAAARAARAALAIAARLDDVIAAAARPPAAWRGGVAPGPVGGATTTHGEATP